MRTDLWQNEHRLVACDLHIKSFEGKNYVEKIDLVRCKVTCGYKTCQSGAKFEIKIKSNQMIQTEELTRRQKTCEIIQ